MHDAYEPVPILEKLPLQIDCLAAWGESVLAAPPHLFMLRYQQGHRVSVMPDRIDGIL